MASNPPYNIRAEAEAQIIQHALANGVKKNVLISFF